MNKKNCIALFISILFGSTFSWLFLYKKVTIKQDNNVLIVGTNSEYPPFSTQEDGKVVGFDIDVITEIAKRLGKTVILKDLPFEALIPEVQLGNIQVVAAGMTETPERAKTVFFTSPLFKGTPLAIVSLKSNSPLQTIEDLKNKNVAVNEGYFADNYISSFPNIHVNRISSAMISEGLLMLESKRADAFITSLASLQPFLTDTYLARFEIHPIPNTEENDFLIVSKKEPELFADIQKVIAEMQRDGTLDKIVHTWLTQ